MPAFDVTSVNEELDTANPGNPVPSQRVSFRTPDGVVGSVLVADSQIGNLEHVQAVVAAKVMQLSAVRNLSTTP
jgi:hypothetical protein